MTLELRVSVDAEADPTTVWNVLTDWAGQSRWIPMTTVAVVGDHDSGLGVRASALSGFHVGKLPIGLLDRFVVTGWRPPDDSATAELEVLHLGPFFTGVGVFRVAPVDDHQAEAQLGQGRQTAGRVRITATELFSLPGGAPVEAAARWALPVMRAGFLSSLRSLQKIVERAPNPSA